MSYSPEHKARTRARIIEAARVLFNRHGFESISIEMIMAEADLTRGGFYNHFRSKEELFAVAVESFLTGRGATWRAEAGVDSGNITPHTAGAMIAGYLSPEHLADLDGQCPMIALPSDVSRRSPDVQLAYQTLLTAMVDLFETSLENSAEDARRQALVLAALCVGGMVLARTLPDSALAEDVRCAAHDAAQEIAGAGG